MSRSVLTVALETGWFLCLHLTKWGVYIIHSVQLQQFIMYVRACLDDGIGLDYDSNCCIYVLIFFSDTDLHAVIKKGTLLKDIHKRYVMYQLLKAIKYLHSGNVIHRDQKVHQQRHIRAKRQQAAAWCEISAVWPGDKCLFLMYSPQPSNVLLDTDCVVKLCDFGLARSLKQFQEDSCNPALTEYVATRWYRAPEILLGSARCRHHLLNPKQLMIVFSTSIVSEYLLSKGTLKVWTCGVWAASWERCFRVKLCFLGHPLSTKSKRSWVPYLTQAQKVTRFSQKQLTFSFEYRDFIWFHSFMFIFQTLWQSDLNMAPLWFRGCYWSKKGWITHLCCLKSDLRSHKWLN